jgi:hypothetical protein
MKSKNSKLLFKGFKALQHEVENKRDFGEKAPIEGLKAEITRKQYIDFLEVLPPLSWDTESGTFYLMEFLTGDLTYKFSKVGKKYFCEVANYRKYFLAKHSKISEKQYQVSREGFPEEAGIKPIQGEEFV